MSRYIDADALMMRVNGHGTNKYGVLHDVDIRAFIAEQPTIDAVPVVHAHWRRYSYDEAICSHCGYDRFTSFECSSEADEKWDELPPYCEECGARMDGERKDKR